MQLIFDWIDRRPDEIFASFRFNDSTLQRLRSNGQAFNHVATARASACECRSRREWS
jgi:hypothetical protein